MRAAMVVLLACVILLSLLSAACLLTHANHEHDRSGGGGCAACAQIHTAENLLKPPGAAVSVITFVLVCLFAAVNIFMLCATDSGTPVNLKIRINN